MRGWKGGAGRGDILFVRGGAVGHEGSVVAWIWMGEECGDFVVNGIGVSVVSARWFCRDEVVWLRG